AAGRGRGRRAVRRGGDRGLEPWISRRRGSYRSAPLLRHGPRRPVRAACSAAASALPDARLRALVSGGCLARVAGDEHVRSVAVVRRVRRLVVLWPHGRCAVPGSASGSRPERRDCARARSSCDDGDLRRARRRDRREQLSGGPDAIADRIADSDVRGDGIFHLEQNEAVHSMTFPELAYITWAKSAPRVAYNLARSSLEPCPVGLLKLK